MTYEEIKKIDAVKTYISQADASLAALGYTEHSFAHVGRVAEMTGYILETMGKDARTVELGKIAGYLHDIGKSTVWTTARAVQLWPSVCWTAGVFLLRKFP